MHLVATVAAADSADPVATVATAKMVAAADAAVEVSAAVDSARSRI
jgi:hypothetical protein